jgi:hypothetical protein
LAGGIKKATEALQLIMQALGGNVRYQFFGHATICDIGLFALVNKKGKSITPSAWRVPYFRENRGVNKNDFLQVSIAIFTTMTDCSSIHKI